jgi:hypothetical protein
MMEYWDNGMNRNEERGVIIIFFRFFCPIFHYSNIPSPPSPKKDYAFQGR